MAVDFAKYQPAKRSPNVAGAASAAAQAMLGAGEIFQRNRQLRQQKEYQEQQAELERSRQALQKEEGEADRTMRMQMLERGAELEALAEARAAEAHRKAQILDLQVQAQKAAQDGREDDFAVLAGALQTFGIEVERTGTPAPTVAPVPHTLAGQAAMGGPQAPLAQPPGPPPLPGVLDDPGAGLPPQNPAIPAAPPTLGLPLALPGGTGGFAPPPVPSGPFAPPPAMGLGAPPPTETGMPAMPLLGPDMGGPGAGSMMAPAVPNIVFRNMNTNEELSVPMAGPGAYEHPEAELSALAKSVVPESQRKFIDAAVPIVRAYMGNSDMPAQLEHVLKWADTLADNDRDERRLRKVGTGTGGGKNASINQILSTYRLENSEYANLLKERDFTGVRDAGIQLQKAVDVLGKRNEKGELDLMATEGVVTMMATSLQSGVLSNQDKRPWQKLPGFSGDLQQWWAENVTKTPPAELVRQLEGVIYTLQLGVKAQLSSIYADAETLYRGADARYQDALMRNDSNNAEVMKYRREEIAHDIQTTFHRNYWKNILGQDDKKDTSKKGRLKRLGIE